MHILLGFLLFIASCNGLRHATVYNFDGQDSSNKTPDIDNHKESIFFKLKHYLRDECFEKLRERYDAIAFLFGRNPKNVYKDICFYSAYDGHQNKDSKLPFTGPKGVEILKNAQEVWKKGDTIFTTEGVLKDGYKDTELNGKDFIKIPCKVKNALLANGSWPASPKYKNLSIALDVLEKISYSSLTEDDPTYLDQIDYLKVLLMRHFDEIKQKLPLLVNRASQLSDASAYAIFKIDTPFALVVYLDSFSMLNEFLTYIKSKEIKLSFNAKQITRTSFVPFMAGNQLSGGVSSVTYSPWEYLIQNDHFNPCIPSCVGLLIDHYKEVDKDGTLDVSIALSSPQVCRDPEILKQVLGEGGSLTSKNICYLIEFGCSSVVLNRYAQGRITERSANKK